jgi:ribonuclease VapC
MREASTLAIGAATLLETGILLSARLHDDARGLLARLLQESGIAVMDVTEAHFGVAMDAWLRYGKGRHPAALNFGDCLSYAVSVVAGEPLLCVGDDFPQTDCVLA